MPKETYTLEQRKTLLANGVSMGDIRASEAEGTPYADALELAITARTAGDTSAQEDADRLAKANKRAMRPENERHPGISVFSYPEGDVARPRPQFKCEMFWLNDKLDYDVTTALEIELMNQLVPGEYRCQRPDGSQFKVDVKAEIDPLTLKMGRLTVWFETRGGLHRVLSSRVQMLREIIEQQKTPELVLA